MRRAAAAGGVRHRYRWVYDQMTKGKVLRVEARTNAQASAASLDFFW